MFCEYLHFSLTSESNIRKWSCIWTSKISFEGGNKSHFEYFQIETRFRIKHHGLNFDWYVIPPIYISTQFRVNYKNEPSYSKTDLCNYFWKTGLDNNMKIPSLYLGQAILLFFFLWYCCWADITTTNACTFRGKYLRKNKYHFK